MSGGQISAAACSGRGKLVCGVSQKRREIKTEIEKERGKLGLLQTLYTSRGLTVVPAQHFPCYVRQAIETASPSVFFFYQLHV